MVNTETKKDIETSVPHIKNWGQHHNKKKKKKKKLIVENW